MSDTDWIYLAACALLVRDGKMAMSPIGPIARHGSFITKRVQFGNIDLAAEHCIRLSTNEVVDPVALPAHEAAEALAIAWATYAQELIR